MPFTSALLGLVMMVLAGAISAGVVIHAISDDSMLAWCTGIIVGLFLSIFSLGELSRIWNYEQPFHPFSDWNSNVGYEQRK